MRVRAALAALLLLLVPAVAGAEAPVARPHGHPAECARLRKQIDHFEGMAERAEAQGNAMWTERTEAHVSLLRERQKDRCPGDVPDESAKEAFLAFMSLLKTAGKAALTYFTFGAM
jgi:hypothetical protein